MDFLEMLKLKAEHWFSGLLMALATFAPGSLILFHYQRDLFLSLELGKIILLSLALTLPVILLNLFLALPHAIENSEIKLDSNEITEPRQHMLSACLFTCVPFYLSLAVGYWFKPRFPAFCLCAAVSNLLLAALSWGTFIFKAQSPSRRR